MTDATKIMTARRIADEILDDGRINLHVSLKAATMLAEGFRLRDQQQARNHQAVVLSEEERGALRFATSCVRSTSSRRDPLGNLAIAILDKLLGGKAGE